ncbi:hypothetical protein BB560_002690 [Smittium megazygosporum]|uniref:Rab3-GAP regulatory subunit N-terminal domain-containing protein n=1 Tax=Smittium megazygosporum TaxID=133381 RepID=A0A2T9ZE33_9FUNG|nr:hypothetical protein BB560_002690 [Smittium megazygosporum]
MSSSLSRHLGAELGPKWNINKVIFQLLSDSQASITEKVQSCSTIVNDSLYVVISKGTKYIVLSKKINDVHSNLKLVSMSPDNNDNIKITAISCIGILNSSDFKKRNLDQLLILVGYENGTLSIFSKEGRPVFTQKFHVMELFRIQVIFDYSSLSNKPAAIPRKTFKNTFDTSSHHSDNSDVSGFYEIILFFRDGIVTSIDAHSLWLSLQLSLKRLDPDSCSFSDERNSFFSFRKLFLNTPSIIDAVSCGPINSVPSQLSTAGGQVSSSNTVSQTVLNSFIVSGQTHMLDFFSVTKYINHSMSAMGYASKVATRVGGAVFNIAKSYLWSSNNQNGTQNSGDRISNSSSSSDATRLTSIKPLFKMSDQGRKIVRIYVSPPQYHLAAMTDTLGRVLLLDTSTFEIIHIWKGFREAQCEWVEFESNHSTLSFTKSFDNTCQLSGVSNLCLVLYASRFGTLQIYSMIDPIKPIAALQIGREFNLIPYIPFSLGESLLAETVSHSSLIGKRKLDSCFLLHSDGFVCSVTLKSK